MTLVRLVTWKSKLRSNSQEPLAWFYGDSLMYDITKELCTIWCMCITPL